MNVEYCHMRILGHSVVVFRVDIELDSDVNRIALLKLLEVHARKRSIYFFMAALQYRADDATKYIGSGLLVRFLNRYGDDLSWQYSFRISESNLNATAA